MGTQLPLPQKGDRAPNFRPISIVAKRLDALRCHLVWGYASAQATLWQMGTQLPPEKLHSPQFLAHVYSGQTAGWIKMPLGDGPGDVDNVVLDGVPAPPKRGTVPQISAHV